MIWRMSFEFLVLGMAILLIKRLLFANEWKLEDVKFNFQISKSIKLKQSQI